MAVGYKLELVLIPVSDPDRAKQFYVEQAGFDLLVDTPTGLLGQRVVQVTPPGSACSIGFGPGTTSAEPGSQQGLHLVVSDILAARAELAGRGVEVGDLVLPSIWGRASRRYANPALPRFANAALL